MINRWINIILTIWLHPTNVKQDFKYFLLSILRTDTRTRKYTAYVCLCLSFGKHFIFCFIDNASKTAWRIERVFTLSAGSISVTSSDSLTGSSAQSEHWVCCIPPCYVNFYVPFMLCKRCHNHKKYQNKSLKFDQLARGIFC